MWTLRAAACSGGGKTRRLPVWPAGTITGSSTTVLKFVEREKRRGNRYDAVIMDPPSFGRGPNGETWKIEAEIDALIRSVCGLLSDRPLFLLVNSYSSGLSSEAVGYMLRDTVERAWGGSTECGELGLPVEASGLTLPCGASARWQADEAGR